MTDGDQKGKSMGQRDSGETLGLQNGTGALKIVCEKDTVTPSITHYE